MKRIAVTLGLIAAIGLASGSSFASSHMDAPLITLDPAANTTDVYAFRSDSNGVEYLTTALAVYPFEEPGIGPNKYNFDDQVLYEIHVALGGDLARGRRTLTYQFLFDTTFRNANTVLQSYLGPIMDVGDANQNLVQTYTVTLLDRRPGMRRRTVLGTGVVPPNNQGLVTRFYNQGDDGDNIAKEGVDDETLLDRYTSQSIADLDDGHRAFAGPNKPFDSQGGFNVHTIVLGIPISELGGGEQVVGVYATTSRRRVNVLRSDDDDDDDSGARFVQVGRQGNPLFCEALVALADKDRYNRTSPTSDARLFRRYALEPELAAVLIPLFGLPANRTTNRTDLAGIFIPDLIKVDLSTGPARLAGAPNDVGFSRLGVFGGDALSSTVQAGLPGFPAGTIPGGWPNGRRFGDDVVDIGLTAIISDLRGDPLMIAGPAGDRVDNNDNSYNKVFPYAATPLNGRNHSHH